MEQSEFVESADAGNACAWRVKNLRCDVCSCGLDSPHRESSARKSSACRGGDSRLRSADGHGGRAFLELSRGCDLGQRGTYWRNNGQRTSKCGSRLEEILRTGESMGAR